MRVEKIPELTTISEACRFTGMDYKTIKKRIENLTVVQIDGRNQFYQTYEVLRNAFIKSTDDEKSELNLTQEKARYFKNLADKVEIEIGKLTDRLLDADQMLLEVSKNRLQVKEKLLNLSYTLANRIPKINDQQQAFNLLQTKFKDILKDLTGEEDLERLGNDQSEDED